MSEAVPRGEPDRAVRWRRAIHRLGRWLAAWGRWWRSQWRRAARAGWRRWTVIVAPLVVAGLLLAADRIAAAQAESTIAGRLEHYGFAATPGVTVDGFPFLTQLLAGRLDKVDVTSGRLRLGPVTASVHGTATGIRLGSGRSGGTISRVSGSALIAYSAIDRLAAASGVPGAQLSGAGPGLLRVRLNVSFFTITAVASVAPAGPSALRLRLVSASAIPSFILQHIRTFTIRLPGLPLGLVLRGVTVARHGVIAAVAGQDVRFTG